MSATARYPGRCHMACGQSIEPGDDIRMTDQGAVHADCTWLTHPGACDR